jgi:molecular chaperone DnaK (HSP70)
LENYVYQIRNIINDEDKVDKLTAEEKSAIEDAVKEKIAWLEKNTTADKEEYDGQYKELERIVKPIFVKLYSVNEEEMPNHDEL